MNTATINNLSSSKIYLLSGCAYYWVAASSRRIFSNTVCIYFRGMGAGLLLEKKIIGTVTFLVSCSGLLKNKYLEKTSWNELIRKGWMLLKRVGLRTRAWTQKIKKQQQCHKLFMFSHLIPSVTISTYSLFLFLIEMSRFWGDFFVEFF